jgi:hypothetical protein
VIELTKTHVVSDEELIGLSQYAALQVGPGCYDSTHFGLGNCGLFFATEPTSRSAPRVTYCVLRKPGSG